MNIIPPRRQVPFTPSGSPAFSPAFHGGINPAPPDIAPDQFIEQKQNDNENTHPAASGQITKAPDGWIDRNVAQERLSLAGIEMDSRRIRHLCARNELESVKVKNEKNQPQYFIDPVSLTEFVEKNSPANRSDVSPDQPPVSPDNMPDQSVENVEEPNPATSGQNEVKPDQQGEKIPAGEWVPKAQLDQALNMIEFLQEEVRHSRTYKNDTAQIANRMLETLETMAVGGRLGPAKEPQPTEPVHVDVHKSGAEQGRKVIDR